MKKFVLGLVMGGILFVPASVLADKIATSYVGDGYQNANVIYQFNCDDNLTHDKCNHVAVFDDQGNKCYVSYDSRGAQSSISCIKE